MQPAVHPELTLNLVRCTSCGAIHVLRAARPLTAVDVCATCHPAYTGRERSVMSGGRIERFEQRRQLAGRR